VWRTYQALLRFAIHTTDNITGTSISTPTTVASAAPEWKPNRLMAAATASSKKFEAPIGIDQDGAYDFVPGDVRNKILRAVRKGLDCILKSQIVTDGQLTVWGQQHDMLTLLPVAARNFEPGWTSGHLESSAKSKPLWARFYDPATLKPRFGDRDKTIHDELNDLSEERRIGYAWYGTWGDKVLKTYAKWAKSHREE
jgi:hypothetical protein